MGLTPNQAKVYLSLVRSGMSTTRTISQVSGIAQHDIYRTTFTLLRLGLINKTLKRPAIFKAIPLKDAIYILIKQKKQELTIIENEARNIVKTFQNTAKEAPKQDDSDIVSIEGKQRTIIEIINLCNNARSSIDFVTASRKLFPFLFLQSKCCLNALDRGVKIRCIIERHETSDPKVVCILKENPSFKMKYLHTIPSVHLGLFDKKITFINTTVEPELADSATLLTKNHCFIDLINDYYEILWMTAMEKLQYCINGEQV